MNAPAPAGEVALAARARALLAFLATPADAALVARMLAWRLCLPVLKYLLPLPRLARLMSAPARPGPRQLARERRIATLTGWVYRPSAALAAHDNCLERSLLAYRYLAREGAEPTLVVGMRRGSGQGPRGHVWVSVDGRPVTDTRASLDPFAAVVSFGAGGVERRDPSPT